MTRAAQRPDIQDRAKISVEHGSRNNDDTRCRTKERKSVRGRGGRAGEKMSRSGLDTSAGAPCTRPHNSGEVEVFRRIQTPDIRTDETPPRSLRPTIHPVGSSNDGRRRPRQVEATGIRKSRRLRINTSAHGHVSTADETGRGRSDRVDCAVEAENHGERDNANSDATPGYRDGKTGRIGKAEHGGEGQRPEYQRICNARSWSRCAAFGTASCVERLTRHAARRPASSPQAAAIARPHAPFSGRDRSGR